MRRENYRSWIILRQYYHIGVSMNQNKMLFKNMVHLKPVRYICKQFFFHIRIFCKKLVYKKLTGLWRPNNLESESLFLFFCNKLDDKLLILCKFLKYLKIVIQFYFRQWRFLTKNSESPVLSEQFQFQLYTTTLFSFYKNNFMRTSRLKFCLKFSKN